MHTQRHFLVPTSFSFCCSSFMKKASFSQYFSSSTGVLIYDGSAQKRKFIFPTATVVTAVTHSLIASSISVCLSALKHLRCKILPYFNRHWGSILVVRLQCLFLLDNIWAQTSPQEKQSSVKSGLFMGWSRPFNSLQLHLGGHRLTGLLWKLWKIVNDVMNSPTSYILKHSKWLLFPANWIETIQFQSGSLALWLKLYEVCRLNQTSDGLSVSEETYSIRRSFTRFPAFHGNLPLMLDIC